MAMHTQNLHQDERTSLLISQPGVIGDPLGAARLTIIGAAKVAPAPRYATSISSATRARATGRTTPFAYYRLEVEGVYFIGGFGVMGRVPAEDYATAAPDPLATVGPEIIHHMNADHSDALCRIAGHDTDEDPDEASMTAVDRLGFHLRLKTATVYTGAASHFPRKSRTGPRHARCSLRWSGLALTAANFQRQPGMG